MSNRLLCQTESIFITFSKPFRGKYYGIKQYWAKIHWKKSLEKKPKKLTNKKTRSENSFLFIAEYLSSSWWGFFLYCFFFHYVSAKFHLWPSSDDCLKIVVSNPTQAGQRFTWSKTWCDRQQLWKAVITGDTVTRLSIPIRGHGKSPEEGQRWNLAETLWKKKQHKKKQPRWRQKVRNK